LGAAIQGLLSSRLKSENCTLRYAMQARTAGGKKGAFMRKLWKLRNGQDLVEFALLAGFVALAAGAIMPSVATSISTVFSNISSVMQAASTQS
jgi:pilus assembly protein Flp/PilA